MSEPLQGKMIVSYSPCKEAGSNSFLILKNKSLGPNLLGLFTYFFDIKALSPFMEMCAAVMNSQDFEG